MDRQEMKQKKMMGAILPGNSTVELREFDMPKPGHGQVVVKAMATTICGSDIRCIYREHVGKGPEGYIPGTVAGHEPCGLIVEEGEGLKRFKKGDRVIIITFPDVVYVTIAEEATIFPARVNSVRHTDGRETVAWHSIFWQMRRI